jgi:hypothetical protein
MIDLAAWVKVNWLFLTILLAIAAAFIFLRSKPSEVASVDELNGVLSAGQPTVVEFYSNF